jgi:hypothetical protein
MARPRPFLLCRYELLVDDEALGARAQLMALKELQGKYFAVTPSAERNRRKDSAIFRPHTITVDRELAVAWSVGRKLGMRVSIEPDQAGSKLELKELPDQGVHYSDFVAIPRLGVMAVDDRSGAPHLGGKAAIARFQAIFEKLDGASANVVLTTTPSDVEKALRSWKLTEFSFVVRPYNPHAPGDLSRDLSEEYKKDGIGRERGAYKPIPGEYMSPSADGPIATIKELADDGYGQYAIRGVTEDGHTAKIKAPKFEATKAKNQERQNELRELRIVIEADTDVDDAVIRHATNALRRFYD